MKNFSLFLLLSILWVEGASQTTANTVEERVLFIVSNAHYYGDSDISAANHFAEIVYAYDVIKKAGFKIDFVSPEGGAIPVGYIQTSDPLIKRYLYDGPFMDELENTYHPDKLKSTDYKAVYYGGGGSAMFGVPENKSIQQIVMEIYEDQQGIVAAICHGTAGIVNLKTKTGDYLVSGKRVNGFPDLFENKEAEYYQQFPFSIEEAIEKHGGQFRYSKEGWDGYTEVDGRLITGQDPSAAALVANKIVELLKNKS